LYRFHFFVSRWLPAECAFITAQLLIAPLQDRDLSQTDFAHSTRKHFYIRLPSTSIKFDTFVIICHGSNQHSSGCAHFSA
jgi:hypothetical protein